MELYDIVVKYDVVDVIVCGRYEVVDVIVCCRFTTEVFD